MLTLVDLSASPQINRAVLVPEVPIHRSVTSCVSVIATGTFTGTPKLTISQDGTNFYPLIGDDGDQIELEAEKPLFFTFANVYIKVDLTGVTSSDLKVTIQ